MFSYLRANTVQLAVIVPQRAETSKLRSRHAVKTNIGWVAKKLEIMQMIVQIKKRHHRISTTGTFSIRSEEC